MVNSRSFRIHYFIIVVDCGGCDCSTFINKLLKSAGSSITAGQPCYLIYKLWNVLLALLSLKWTTASNGITKLSFLILLYVTHRWISEQWFADHQANVISFRIGNLVKYVTLAELNFEKVNVWLRFELVHCVARRATFAMSILICLDIISYCA